MFDNIKYLLLSICFSSILIFMSSSLYLVRSNYNKTYAIIEKSNCVLSESSKEYICDLMIKYLIDNDIIINQIIIKSSKSYKIGDIIEIEYDVNNIMNISFETYYKKYALVSFLSAIIILLISIYLINKIKDNTNEKLNNLFSLINFVK